MQAVIYRRYGPPDVLETADVSEPAVGHDQLFVRVRATSVNPIDWKFRSGTPRIPLFGRTRIPGLDVAGEVVRSGSSVTRFKPGDEIYAMLSAFAGGGCAEYAAVPERSAAVKPRNLTFEEAAAVPLAALTALHTLRDRARIQAGDRVLINGASGGVGSFAVQIARMFGAEVTGVTSGKNLDLVRSLGAHHAIDYTVGDFTTGDRSYDVIFDTVSSRSFRQCRAALSPRGIYLATLPQLSTVIRMITGAVFGGKRSRVIMVRPSGPDLDRLREWIEAGRLHPVIDRVFPLRETAAAHAYSETGHAKGKIVITVSGEEKTIVV